MLSDSQTQSLFERIKALFTGEQASAVALVTAELASVKQALAAATAELLTLKESHAQSLIAKDAELTSVREQLASLQSSLTTVTAERDALKAQVTDPAGTIRTEAARVAAATLASHGVPAERLDDSTVGTTATYEAVQKQLAAETDPTKAAALAMKCRELRGHANLFA